MVFNLELPISVFFLISINKPRSFWNPGQRINDGTLKKPRGASEKLEESRKNPNGRH